MTSILDFLAMKENRSMPAGKFDEFFEQNIKKYETYRQAYEATEQDYQELNGERRYASWDSYENVRCRKRRKKNQP